MIIADSSFLIAFFKEDDSQHTKAIEEMQNYENQKIDIMVTEHVLGETATILLYYKNLDAANEFLKYAEENFFIQGWDNDDFQVTLKTFKNQKHELSYVDASIVYLARFLRMPVATYDAAILKEIHLNEF